MCAVHHPLALETGLKPEEARRSESSERDALAQASWSLSPAIDRSHSGGHTTVEAETQSGGLLHGQRPGAFCLDRKQERTDHAPAALDRRNRAAQALTVLVRALAIDRSEMCNHHRGRPVTRAARGRELEPRSTSTGLVRASTCWGLLPQDGSKRLYAGADIFVAGSAFDGHGREFAEALA